MTLLYKPTGDANGHIKVWEISSAIQRWGIKPFHTDDSLSNINKDSSSSSSVHPAYSSHMEDPSDTSMADLSSIIDSGKLDDDDTGVSFVQDGKKADIHGDVLNHGSQKRDSGGSGVNDTSIRKRNKLQPIRSRFADYVRYRNEPCHRNLAYTLTMNAQKNVNRNTLLKPGDIKLKRWWSAHGDSIRDLRFILDPQPRGLISCAFDKKVCLWDFQGASLGHLQQGRQGGTKQRNLDPPYRFHSDLSGRRQRQQNHALKVRRTH